MISERALAALRCSAAVLHSTSGVRLRLSHTEGTLFEISEPPFPDADHAVLPTCRFRAAVARAHAQSLLGYGLAMCGLPEDVDPQISYGVGANDRVLPGGVLRLERHDLWLHVTAFAQNPTLDAVLMSFDAEGTGLDLETLDDDALDVAVVCIATGADDVFASALAIDRLGDLSAAVAIAEIEAHLHDVAESQHHDS